MVEWEVSEIWLLVTCNGCRTLECRTAVVLLQADAIKPVKITCLQLCDVVAT
jgi:hypothetical protein